MPITINHDLTATTPDNTSYEIRPSHWNSTHAATVSLVGSEVVGAFSNANGVSFGLNPQGAVTASIATQGGIGISAGNNSQRTGVVSFQNANNVSFGLDGVGNLTGSVGPSGLVVSAGNVASNLSSIVFSNSNGFAFGLNGSTITGSYTVPPGGISVAAGGVTDNLSEIVLSNSNGLAFGLQGSTITGSYTVPSIAGLLSAIALSAGIASAMATGVTFSNSNNVSFGENNGTITASATFAQSNQILTLLAGSNTTQGSSGTANASNHIFAGAGNVSVGISNGSVVISGGASGTNPAIGAISAGTQSQTSGTIVFSNSNGVTFGLSNGTLTATVNPGPAAGIAAVAANGSTQTTGSVIFSASNGITFGIATGAGAGTVTASYTVPTQTVQTQNAVDLSFGGNTSGALALISSGTAVLFGGNNITLSQAGNSLTISAANQVPLQTGISGFQVSNATYTSGTVTLQNANGISFGSSGANGISASYTVPSTAGLISAINVSAGVAAQNMSAIVFSNSNGVSFGLNGSTITGSIAPVFGSLSAGTTNAVLGQVVFSNSNSVSFGLAGNTITASVNAPINMSAGTQAVVRSDFTFSNSNGVSFGMNNGVVTASISTNAGGGAGISAIQAGTQIQTSGGITFSNSGGVSFGLNAGVLTEAVGISAFAIGNTTQNTSGTYNVSNLTFSGAGNVSIGNSNGAIVVSAPVGLSAGFSTGGNTLGTTGLAANRLVLAGGANITLSGSTNAGSMTISIVGAAGGTGGASTIGAFALGNTTQSSQGTLTNSNISFVGGGIISVGVSNGSVLISAPGSTGISQSLFATGNTTLGTSGTQGIGSILFQGAGNVSVGMSNGSVVISGAGGGGGGGGINFGVSTGGNTLGTTGTVSTGNVVLVGAGVITLSQSSSGSNATISIFAPNTSSLSGTGQVSISLNGSTINVGVPILSLFGASNTTQGTSSPLAANGSLVFAGAGNVSVGMTNGSVVISGAGGGGNGAAVSIGGNSTSAGAGYSNISSGTAVFFGGNNITLSQNGASITLSGANIGGAQTGISGIQVSNTTYTAGTVTFQNANGISFGSSGAGGISASYTVPVVPSTAAYFFQGNTTGQSSSSTAGDQTLSISMGGLVSGGWSGGSLLFSASQSNQAFSASGGSSAFQTLSFANSNGITFSNSNGSVIASHAILVSAAGGTSNALSAITFSNLNGVSFGLSTGVGVGTLTASISQSNQTISFAGLSNTAGNTSGVSIDARSISFVGAGAVSVGFSTSAGGTSIIVSAAAGGQSNQTLSYAANGNTTGNTSGITVDARSLTIGGLGGASVGYSTSAGGSTILVSSPVSSSMSATGAASVSLNGNTWTVGVPAVSMGISGGNTLGNTGTVSNQIVFAGGSNITLSGATNAGGMTVTISGGAGGGGGGVGIQVSNTTYTSGTVIFSNANGISFGSTAGGVTASYTVPTQTVQTVGLYGSSQTTNSSSGTVDARSLSFVGQGNVSVGFSNGSFLINDGGAGATTAGFFATGNTTQNSSGTVALSSQLYNFLGAMTGGISAGSIQISAPATSSISGTGLVSIVTQISTISIGVNAAGTSFSTTSVSGANYAGTINTNGITLSIPYLTRYVWPAAPQLTVVTAPSNANMSIQYVPIYQPVTGSRLDALIALSAGSAATSNTAGLVFSQYAIIYTLNGGTLSSLSSGSTQTTYTYASNTAGHTELTANAIRPVSVPMNFNMAPGEYYIGFNLLTNVTSIGAATTNLGATISMMGGNDLQTALNYAEFGSNTANSSNLFRIGVYSAATTGVVTRVSLSAINQTGSALSAGNIALVFRNG